MHKGHKYTMSAAALQQRRLAARKSNPIGKMTVVKISQDNCDWARIQFGTINKALDYLRKLNVERG